MSTARIATRAAAVPLAVSSSVALSLYQGDDYQLEVTLQDSVGAPIDPALWDWKAQIRETTADADAGGPPAAEFTATIAGMVLSLTLVHGDSAALTSTSYRWDLQGTEVGTGWVTTYLAGPVVVTAEVTR